MAIGPKKIKKVKTSPKVVSTNAVVSNVATLNLGNKNEKSKSNFKQFPKSLRKLRLLC